MVSVYLYAVSYDLGFAPNPFGGLCSLACCKPNIRQRAQLGDWIIGSTGTKLPPALRCVFAMVVTAEQTFDSYWTRPEFASRKAKRNGTQKKIVGDNIYHRADTDAPWIQEDSVHSLEDGSQCPLNTGHDTRVNRILLSDRFVYFGASAPTIPVPVRQALGLQRNPRDYRRYDWDDATSLIDWLQPQIAANANMVVDDPINFNSSSMRYSQTLQRMI